jgi:leucyl-tRNA synthetase
MRVYEMFMGPLEVSKPWSTNGIAGVRRFLDRVWRLGELPLVDDEPTPQHRRLLHKTIRKVSQDTGNLEFNTAISQMMIFVNETTALDRMPRTLWEPFLLLLSPYAPHLVEELWQKAGRPASVARETWPAWDEELARDDLLEIVFQVNGKVRARVSLPAGLGQDELSAKALENERVRQFTDGKAVRKVIVVPDRLVNIVAT